MRRRILDLGTENPWLRCSTVLFSVILLASFLVNNSHASLSTSSTIDWTSKTYKGTDTIQTSDHYEYTHTLQFDPVAASIESVTLSLTHYGNTNREGREVWLISGTQALTIDSLTASNRGWATDTFTLDKSLFSGASGASTWTITIMLNEDTIGNDRLWLDKSILTAQYAPVPIPGTALLLAPALLVLWSLRRLRSS